MAGQLFFFKEGVQFSTARAALLLVRHYRCSTPVLPFEIIFKPCKKSLSASTGKYHSIVSFLSQVTVRHMQHEMMHVDKHISSLVELPTHFRS